VKRDRGFKNDFLPVVTHGKPEICNDASQVSFDQDVLCLDVPVSNHLLATGTLDLRVQVGNASGGRMCHDQLERHYLMFLIYYVRIFLFMHVEISML